MKSSRLLNLILLFSFFNSLNAQELVGEVLDKKLKKIKEKKLQSFVEIEFVSKKEFLDEKQKYEPYIAIKNKINNIKKQIDVFKLPCNRCSSNFIYLEKQKYERIIKYRYIGEVLNQYLIAENYYETVWNYAFYDKNTGKQTLVFYDYPKFINKESQIFVIYSSPSVFSGTYFKSINITDKDLNKSKVNFEITLNDWMLNFKSQSLNNFVTKEGVIYAEVISEKHFHEFVNNYENNKGFVKYIRLKSRHKNKK